jgi:sRNA-binding carbon storage regulator CsrA
VQLGISAPASIAVHRYEIAQRISREDPEHGHRK